MQIGAAMFFTDYSITAPVLARALEERGFESLWAPEHSHIPVDTKSSFPLWDAIPKKYYDVMDPFVSLTAAAVATETLKLGTGICLVQQRDPIQTAKLVASIDQVSGGRFLFGVGTGWNAVEYDALNEDFSNRGLRSEEQIDVLRKLWADETVTFSGKWHQIEDAGINPLPESRSIPVWLGGMAPQVVERVGRIADGWFPFFNPNLGEQLKEVRRSAELVGRDPASIGVECMAPLADAGNQARDQLKNLQDIGVTHSAVVTMNAGLVGAQQHIDALKRYRDATGSIVS